MPILVNIVISCWSTPYKIFDDVKIELIGSWYNEELGEVDLYIAIQIEMPDGNLIFVESEQ